MDTIRRCTDCGEPQSLEHKTVDYPESGLDNVVLHDVPVWVCKNGHEEVEIPAMTALHKILASVVTRKPIASLTAAEIQFLRRREDARWEEIDGQWVLHSKTLMATWKRRQTDAHDAGGDTGVDHLSGIVKDFDDDIPLSRHNYRWLLAEVTRLREVESDFQSFLEHHRASEAAWLADHEENARLKEGVEDMKAGRIHSLAEVDAEIQRRRGTNS